MARSAEYSKLQQQQQLVQQRQLVVIWRSWCPCAVHKARPAEQAPHERVRSREFVRGMERKGLCRASLRRSVGRCWVVCG